MAEPRIIEQDDQSILLEKPAGLAVHPAATEKKHEPTLVDWLLEKFPEVRGVGEDPLRPGIVHRLDRDTSGVMVVARTQNAFTKLKTAFKERAVSKRYLVLVYGRVPWDKKTAELSIARTGSGMFGARHPRDVEALQQKSQGRDEQETIYRPAVTDFVVLKRYTTRAGELTLLQARPKTGRTHQIRVHLKALGYPVVGDQLYAPKKLVAASKKAGLGRQFLHAAELTFVHPGTGVKKTASAELPADLQAFIAQIE